MAKDTILDDTWIMLPENYDTGLVEIETTTRGRDCPARGYFVAYAYSETASYMVAEHNKRLAELERESRK